jgi:hypothetical protein
MNRQALSASQTASSVPEVHTYVFRVLVQHFFRRFFDNDTVQVEGDTQTTVVRAIAVVTVPGMMFAFFLQNSYPRKDPWLAMGDQYFFVLLSFLVMAAVSIFEWEMLFPDRLDFLVLSTLPIKAVQMLAAKASALLGFLALFLFASNALAIVMLPAVSKGDFFRQMYAHAIAVLLAGSFAALLILALGGILLCVLDPAYFRMAAPAMQLLSVMALTLLFLQYLSGGALQLLKSQPQGIARWLPPLWFLGLYQERLHGAGAPAFAAAMARRAIDATAIAAMIVILTYPVAWARMRTLAVEGASRKRREPRRWISQLVNKLVRKPAERALFHFIGQSIAQQPLPGLPRHLQRNGRGRSACMRRQPAGQRREAPPGSLAARLACTAPSSAVLDARRTPPCVRVSVKPEGGLDLPRLWSRSRRLRIGDPQVGLRRRVGADPRDSLRTDLRPLDSA